MKNLGTFPCLFEITYYDDVAERIVTSRGMVYADSSYEAMETLEDYFGLPEKIEIQVFSDGIPEMSEDLYTELLNFLKERENL